VVALAREQCLQPAVQDLDEVGAAAARTLAWPDIIRSASEPDVAGEAILRRAEHSRDRAWEITRAFVREVVSNASPLQYLFQTDLLDLLSALYGVIGVPDGVMAELAQRTRRAACTGPSLPHRGACPESGAERDRADLAAVRRQVPQAHVG
jgi:hypothetical protein